jgi:hypothetical protein
VFRHGARRGCSRKGGAQAHNRGDAGEHGQSLKIARHHLGGVGHHRFLVVSQESIGGIFIVGAEKQVRHQPIHLRSGSADEVRKGRRDEPPRASRDDAQIEKHPFGGVAVMDFLNPPKDTEAVGVV